MGYVETASPEFVQAFADAGGWWVLLVLVVIWLVRIPFRKDL